MMPNRSAGSHQDSGESDMLVVSIAEWVSVAWRGIRGTRRGPAIRDQSGTVIGPREPNGGLRGRHQGSFDWPLHPFQPQLAWLQGTVLIVEVNGEISRV